MGRDGARGFPWVSEGSNADCRSNLVTTVSDVFTGQLINSIRVICRSYDDYQEWLYCLKTAQFRNADSSLSGSESFSGSKLPHPGQVTDVLGLHGNQ